MRTRDTEKEVNGMKKEPKGGSPWFAITMLGLATILNSIGIILIKLRLGR